MGSVHRAMWSPGEGCNGVIRGPHTLGLNFMRDSRHLFSDDFLTSFWYPYVLQFWSQLGPNLAPNLGPKSTKNPSKSLPKSILNCMLFLITFLIHFRLNFEGFSTPKSNKSPIKKSINKSSQQHNNRKSKNVKILSVFVYF